MGNKEKLKVITIVAIFVLAVFLRFWNLEDIDIRPDPDAQHVAIPALNMVDNPSSSTIFESLMPTLNWMVATSFLVFGKNEFALRFPGAAISVLSVIGVYLFCRKYIGEEVGYLSALFLATLPMHVMYSKLTYKQPILSFYSLIAIYLLLESRRKKSYFFLVALLIGWILLTKHLEGILPVLSIFLFIFFSYLFESDKKTRTKQKKWALHIVGAFLLGALIFLIYAAYSDKTHTGLPGYRTSWDVIYIFSGLGGPIYNNPIYWFIVSILSRSYAGYIFVPMIFGSILLLNNILRKKDAFSILVLSWLWVPFLVLSYGANGEWHFNTFVIPYVIISSYGIVTLLKAYKEKTREGLLFPPLIFFTFFYIYFIIWTADIWLLKLYSSGSSILNFIPTFLANVLSKYLQTISGSSISLYLADFALVFLALMLFFSLALYSRYYRAGGTIGNNSLNMGYLTVFSLILLTASIPTYHVAVDGHVLGKRAYDYYKDYSDEMARYISDNLNGQEYAVAVEGTRVIETYLRMYDAPTSKILNIPHLIEGSTGKLKEHPSDAEVIGALERGEVKYVIINTGQLRRLVPTTELHPQLWEWVSNNCVKINSRGGIPPNFKRQLLECPSK